MKYLKTYEKFDTNYYKTGDKVIVVTRCGGRNCNWVSPHMDNYLNKTGIIFQISINGNYKIKFDDNQDVLSEIKFYFPPGSLELSRYSEFHDDDLEINI